MPAGNRDRGWVNDIALDPFRNQGTVDPEPVQSGFLEWGRTCPSAVVPLHLDLSLNPLYSDDLPVSLNLMRISCGDKRLRVENDALEWNCRAKAIGPLSANSCWSAMRRMSVTQGDFTTAWKRDVASKKLLVVVAPGTAV